MAKLTKERVKYLVDNRSLLDEREHLIHIFSEEKYKPTDTFLLSEGDIENYKGKPIETTVGRYVFNYCGLVIPFGDKVPYINEQISTSKLEKNLCKLVLKDELTVEQYKKFMDCAYRLLHFSELFVPSMSPKSFRTSDKVKKKKQELLDKYQDQLDDPIIMSQIEKELLELDQDYIKNDPSYDFYKAIGGKAFNIHRKKMFLTVGGIEEFGENKHVFIKHALADGWNLDQFPEICDEIRKGSYNRGTETAKGGELTKYIIRVFENVSIDSTDCGTKRGIEIDITKDNMQTYTGRYIIEKGKYKLLDEQTIGSYVGKTVVMRSPMFCKQQHGFCNRCLNILFEQLGMKNIGMELIKVSSTFLTHAMKNMHGTAISTVSTVDDRFFL